MMERMAGFVGATVAAALMSPRARRRRSRVPSALNVAALLVSSAEMDQSAAAAYQKVLRSRGPKGNVNKNPQQVERVRGIAKRIIPQTGVSGRNAPGWNGSQCPHSPEINGGACPAQDRVLHWHPRELELTDDEIAAVMGHEIPIATERVERAARRSSLHSVGASAVGAGVVSGSRR